MVPHAPSGLQLDIACTIARIEQIQTLPAGDTLRELLIERLTYDAKRLTEYLTDDTKEWEDWINHKHCPHTSDEMVK